MSVEQFLFAALLLVALIVLPNSETSRDANVPLVVMDLLEGPDYRRDGLRK